MSENQEKVTSGRYEWEDDPAYRDELRKAISYCIKKSHEYGFVDVGEGTELEIGVSREALDQAVQKLVHDFLGYTLETVIGSSITNPEDKAIAQVLRYENDYEWTNEEYTDGKMYVVARSRNDLPNLLFVSSSKELTVEYFHKYKDKISDLCWIEVPVLNNHPWTT